jgi:hypothetical protein
MVYDINGILHEEHKLKRGNHLESSLIEVSWNINDYLNSLLSINIYSDNQLFLVIITYEG